MIIQIRTLMIGAWSCVGVSRWETNNKTKSNTTLIGHNCVMPWKQSIVLWNRSSKIKMREQYKIVEICITYVSMYARRRMTR